MKKALFALMLLQLWVTCYDHAEVLRLRRDVVNMTLALDTLQRIEFDRQRQAVNALAAQVSQDSTQFEEMLWKKSPKNRPRSGPRRY